MTAIGLNSHGREQESCPARTQSPSPSPHSQEGDSGCWVASGQTGFPEHPSSSSLESSASNPAGQKSNSIPESMPGLQVASREEKAKTATHPPMTETSLQTSHDSRSRSFLLPCLPGMSPASLDFNLCSAQGFAWQQTPALCFLIQNKNIQRQQWPDPFVRSGTGSYEAVVWMQWKGTGTATERAGSGQCGANSFLSDLTKVSLSPSASARRSRSHG